LLGRESGRGGRVPGCAGMGVPVKAEKEMFGTLLPSPHIERSGFGRKDRQALGRVGRIVGMRLASSWVCQTGHKPS